MNAIFQVYNSVFYDAADPRTRDWALMGNPTTIIFITLLWLLFILKLGPNYMHKRKPMSLKSLILIVNAIQVISNFYVLYEYLAGGWLTGYRFQCEPIDHSNSPSAIRMARTTHFYLLLKLTDMIDTVIYVLRKKNEQISFLHVYHHLSTLLLAWIITEYAPNGHGTFVQLLNTVIHVLMYTYYFISALGPQFQKYLWWKRYLTRIQLGQFVVQFTHNINALRIDCAYPRHIIYLFMPIIIVMFMLFLNFYVKAYSKRKHSDKKK